MNVVLQGRQKTSWELGSFCVKMCISSGHFFSFVLDFPHETKKKPDKTSNYL